MRMIFEGKYSTVTELMGIGTRENPNIRMLILHIVIIILLTIVPFMIAEISKRKLFYVIGILCVSGYQVVLGLAAWLICNNMEETALLMKNAAICLVEYTLFVIVRLHMKKMTAKTINLSIDYGKMS